MSFSPLPRNFLTDIARRPSEPVVELGCGDGRFGAVLAAAGARVVGLDRSRPRSGIGADVVCDVVVPPLRPGSVAILAAANVLRHLAPGRPPAVPLSWPESLRPDGVLWIFEDQPDGATAAAANYRDLQSWLAAVVPGRAPLLPVDDFRAAQRDATGLAGWEFGLQANSYPARAGAAIDLLTPARGEPEGAARRLIDGIRADGLEYGEFWWARYAPGKDGG